MEASSVHSTPSTDTFGCVTAHESLRQWAYLTIGGGQIAGVIRVCKALTEKDIELRRRVAEIFRGVLECIPGVSLGLFVVDKVIDYRRIKMVAMADKRPDASKDLEEKEKRQKEQLGIIEKASVAQEEEGEQVLALKKENERLKAEVQDFENRWFSCWQERQDALSRMVQAEEVAQARSVLVERGRATNKELEKKVGTLKTEISILEKALQSAMAEPPKKPPGGSQEGEEIRKLRLQVAALEVSLLEAQRKLEVANKRKQEQFLHEIT